MSLSRFYKKNHDFQAKAVLDSNAVTSTDPVWGSIVKEDQPDSSELYDNPPQEPKDPEASITPAPDQDTVAESQQEEEDVTVESSPPPALPEVSIDIEAIEQNAFTSGIEAGRKQAEEDFENSAKTLLCICKELDALRETILRNSTGEMKELVLAISEKIIRHSVHNQEETIVETLKDAINLAVKSDEFLIQVHPEDLEILSKKKEEIIDSISGLDNIVLKADATLERGGCKLESTCCTVDASMASQIKIIHESVMASENLAELNKSADPE